MHYVLCLEIKLLCINYIWAELYNIHAPVPDTLNNLSPVTSGTDPPWPPAIYVPYFSSCWEKT